MQCNDNMIRALEDKGAVVGITGEEWGGIRDNFGAHAIQNSQVQKFQKNKKLSKSPCVFCVIFLRDA